MKKFILLLAVAVFAACSDNNHKLTHDGARAAAESFYAMLVHGESARYVDALSGMLDADSLTRREMVEVVTQFIRREQDAHQGIVSAVAQRDTIYADSLAQVFIDVTYGDSTTEHVMLPLVYTRGEWKMR